MSTLVDSPKWPAVMVDLETMGMPPKGAVLRIGLVPFSLAPGEERVAPREDWFDVGLSIGANVAAGRHLDPSTVAWWLCQDKVAQEALLDAPVFESRDRLVDVLDDYLRAEVAPGAEWWARSPQFDLVLLSDLGFSPWDHRAARCHRTLEAVALGAGLPGEAPDAPSWPRHVASGDAARQAAQVVCWVRAMRGLGR